MLLKRITNLRLGAFITATFAILFTSCGSFQYVGYDNDGIYSSSGDNETGVVEQSSVEDVVTTDTDDSNYYRNYFAENSAQLNAMQEESEIFTDIDSYEGNYVERVIDTTEQRVAYGGWGQATENVTINIIDNGWGWNNWGWGQPWGWNNGFAWNNGFNRNSNRFSFSNGRRGYFLNSNGSIANRRNTAVSRRNYSSNRFSSNRNFSSRRNTSTARRSGTTTTRSSRSRVSRPSSSSRTIRNSSSTRSSRSSSSARTRSSRSSSSMGTRSSRSRSSGSVRSSGSMRSSGGSRSSGGGRRGRS